MVRLENLSKTYHIDGHAKTVARDINVTFPSGIAVAILGRNGAGKSTLMRIIAGTEDPSSGRVVSSGSISWPVGFSGSFHADLTGQQNVRFIGRIYGVDTDALSDFVEEFAELGRHYRLPLRSYSSGMRSRLAFGTSMGVQFDTYLVDEVTAAGDASFRSRAEALLRERIRSAGAIMVTHSMGQVRAVCQAVAVLENGRLSYYDDIEAGIARHLRNLGL